MDNMDYKRLIEAALFMSPRAMSVEEISKVTGIASIGTLESMLKELVSSYRNSETVLDIVEIGSKYMFALKEPYAAKVSNMATRPDLSKGALRILAYVNKNPSALQSELVKNFGAGIYDDVRELVENEFVETKKSGRSRKIMTTQKFKEYFNVN